MLKNDKLGRLHIKNVTQRKMDIKKVFYLYIHAKRDNFFYKILFKISFHFFKNITRGI